MTQLAVYDNLQFARESHSERAGEGLRIKFKFCVESRIYPLEYSKVASQMGMRSGEQGSAELFIS